MNPERRRKVDQIVASAMETEPGRRSAFLDEVCGSDDELRREAETLLNAIVQAGSFLEEPLDALQTKSAFTPGVEIGQTIGHYRILSMLGQGGMGEVYLARDVRLGRQVALKVLRRYITSDEERVRRFRREARAASALNHPNILTIYDIGQVDDLHFIATEFIEGETLRQRLTRQRLSVPEALDVAIQVSAALTAAHDAGIVHRDIKPENIMLRPDGYMKVLDFGIAKLIPNRQAVDTSVPTLEMVETYQHSVIGSPAYMSPEQARGLMVDTRSDIFSLGTVLYEMITGASPFVRRTLTDTLVAIVEKEPPPLSETAPNVPAELEHIVSRALCKDRQERYQTTGDLMGVLKPLKQRLEFQQSNQDQPVGAKNAANESQWKDSQFASASLPRPRHRAVRWLLLAVAVMAVIGVSIWRFMPRAPVVAIDPPPAVERLLDYSIRVQQYRDGKPYEEPFTLAGADIIFQKDYRIKLNLTSPQSGYFYVVNEPPVKAGDSLRYLLVFAASHLEDGQEPLKVEIPEGDWLQFDNVRGTEKLWLVWSAHPVAELEAARDLINPQDQGEIKDPDQSYAVQQLLEKYADGKVESVKNSQLIKTSIKAEGEVLVYPLELQHR